MHVGQENRDHYGSIREYRDAFGCRIPRAGVQRRRDISQCHPILECIVQPNSCRGRYRQAGTATEVIEAAIKNFGTVDILVNNAGIFRKKPFTEFTTEDFNALVSINLLGFFQITQLVVREMLKRRSGSVVTISASLADQPIAASTALSRR